jgi:hypothetical protein
VDAGSCGNHINFLQQQNLENVMLSKRRQPQKDECCMILILEEGWQGMRGALLSPATSFPCGFFYLQTIAQLSY